MNISNSVSTLSLLRFIFREKYRPAPASRFYPTCVSILLFIYRQYFAVSLLLQYPGTGEHSG
ncbi:hypothetical protein KCP78_17080 [Salmonella enterica subsp. enterica]|nr:hypothetical protein KCP78_17080 [Salmonella enterica subsp. enterica]